jgi:hypothetical protein
MHRYRRAGSQQALKVRAQSAPDSQKRGAFALGLRTALGIIENARMIKHWVFISLAIVGIASSTIATAEEPVDVTVCDIKRDPGVYNHKLLKVTGDVSRGFEDFTLSDESCGSSNTIWLEFGGTKGSEVIYCCGVAANSARPKSLTVEGFETPLVRDQKLKMFEKMTNRKSGYGTAKATIIGRYFSGEKRQLPGGTIWMGYGHMGMATLLVIQQVVAVH